MASIPDIMFFVVTFLAIYIQIFFLVTFMDNRNKLVTRRGQTKLASYPAVTVIVPCWNEETTIFATIKSLLALNYPKDKVNIILIDDGSTDNTWEVIKKFVGHSNIKIFHKENGGKHTALNFGLLHTNTEFVGCLDADSLVHPECLVRIMSYFEADRDTMAVVPSVVVYNPKNMIQKAQAFEHFITVFMRKMHGLLGAVSVLPGPFSIYKKKVFDDLGPYRQAYNVEDTEMAYRMQKNHYKIDDCNDAYVYTNMPSTLVKLYRQRLRWIYGIINNIIDYRDVIFKKKYGDFSMIIIPSVIILMFSALYMFGIGVYHLLDFIISKIMKLEIIGFHLSNYFSHFDMFFVPARFSFIIILLVYFFIVLVSTLGRKMVEDKWVISFDAIYFFLIFSFFAPFWLMKAVYNTILSKKPVWR
ncbi:MAG: glycosyltransferase [Candidatus Nomurabacteria bacterium]|nr:glycosyltransferase [Candidatus Nomurabacteria bacterium]